MNRHLVFALILASLLTSCGKEKKQDEKISTTQSQKIVTDSIAPIQFDWTKTAKLKRNTIEELKKKEKSKDKIIMNFLNKYTKLVEEFDNILIDYKDYESLNTLDYSDEKLVKQCALDFKRKVEANGFRIAHSEGTIYISQNTDFIKSEILSLADSISIEFINLYCNEFDNICCEDAGVIIPTDEIINRIYKWGELSKKAKGFDYNDYVEKKFIFNLELLFVGSDNTPSFDFETQKFDKNSIELMTKFIENNPNARATEEFKPFIELLKSENYKQTKIVDDYFKKKFNYCG